MNNVINKPLIIIGGAGHVCVKYLKHIELEGVILKNSPILFQKGGWHNEYQKESAYHSFGYNELYNHC